MVAATVKSGECFYFAVAKKFNSNTACKVNFSASEYGPDAVTAMCKALGVGTPAGLTEFQLMRINDDKTYTLTAEKFSKTAIKELTSRGSEAARKKAENEALVDKLVKELSKLNDEAKPITPTTETRYTSYKIAEAYA